MIGRVENFFLNYKFCQVDPKKILGHEKFLSPLTKNPGGGVKKGGVYPPPPQKAKSNFGGISAEIFKGVQSPKKPKKKIFQKKF